MDGTINVKALAILLVICGGLGLFNIILSVSLFQLYSSLLNKYKAVLEELKECKQEKKELQQKLHTRAGS